MHSDDAPPTAERLLAETAWVRALARTLVVDPGTADDVAQDAAVIALTHGPSNADAVRAWFRRVVGNLAHNARRSSSRRTSREQANAASERSEASDEVVARWEIRKKVVEAVLALEEPYRSTILLRYFDGLTAAEAAARLGTPLETVRTRTRRGLELLRGRLADLDDRRGRKGMAVLLLLAHRDRDVATAGMVAGGAAMASTTKWAVGAAIAVLLGLGATWAVVTKTPSSPPSPAPEVATAATGPAKPRRSAASDAPAADATIDLSACDRERDLFGVVLDPDGRPVAGARVTALRKVPWGVTIRTRDYEHMYGAAESTRTATDGGFKLRLSPGDEVSLRVDADGFAIWESSRRQAGERMTVRLARGLTLEVVVKTKDGAAVADTPVRAGVETGLDFVARYARTDAAGRARFERMPRGAGGSVTVAQSLVHQPVRLADADAQTVEVTLPESRLVRGTVVDAATKTGIEGARVSVYGGFGQAVATDSLGRFELQAFDRKQVVAEAQGYAKADLKVEKDADLAFVLERSSRLTGRIVDEGGHPIGGADVSLIGNSDMGGRFEQSSSGGATTGEEGRFAVDGLLPGRLHLLRVHADGQALLYREEYTGPIDKADRDVGDVVLGAPRTLRGAVLDAEGAVVVRERVDLAGLGGQRDLVPHVNRSTDDLGRFAFPELPPGAYELSVRSSGRVVKTEVTVPETGDLPLVTLRIGVDPPRETPTIPVTLSVTDEEGRPIEGARAYVGYVANGTTGWTNVGADGVLKVEAEAFPATVSAMGPEGGEVRYLSTLVWLRPGERDAKVVLRRGAVIAGRVVDEKGGAVAQAWVEAFDGARQAGAATADGDGRFELIVPAGGRFDVRASIPHAVNDSAPPKRSVAEAFGVAAGTKDLALKMIKAPASHDVDVLVVNAQGDPVAGAWVHAEFAGSDWSRPVSAMTDAEGHALVAGLPRSAVTYTVTIPDPQKRPGTEWHPQPVRVAGDADTVRITVGATRTVRGRVVCEDGSPVAGAFITVSTHGSSFADDDGRFTVDVPAELPFPFPVYGHPADFAKQALSGYDLADADDRELSIVLHPVPKR